MSKVNFNDSESKSKQLPNGEVSSNTRNMVNNLTTMNDIIAMLCSLSSLQSIQDSYQLEGK